MAITRDAAFRVFDDLLAEGLRPVITGFRSKGGVHSHFWPEGREGYFVYTHFESGTRVGELAETFVRFADIADRHGLEAWFAGKEPDCVSDDGPGNPEFRVVFVSKHETRHLTDPVHVQE